MRILVTYFSQTNNTKKIALGIQEELQNQKYDVDIKRIEETSPNSLGDYDLVFVGSACHDSDLAEPVKQLLEQIHTGSLFKMAGFVTHATDTGEGDERGKEMYEKWAGKCVVTFTRVCEEKNIGFLGYFHCLGKPMPPIAGFIHQEIVIGEEEWRAYEKQVQDHPDENDVLNAKAFSRRVLSKFAEKHPNPA